jgi:hypothetical protein
MLNKILQWNDKDKGKSQISYTYYQNTLGNQYPTILVALEAIGTITNDRVWIAKTEDFKGKCYAYKVTDICCQALADSNRQYLYKLLSDRNTKRKNQIRISKRGYNTKTYGDVRDSLKTLIDGISFDIKEIDNAVANYNKDKKALVYSLLMDMTDKTYNELKYNVKDGRVWTPYGQLPSDIKKLIKVNNYDHIRTIDIRSCYPSLWAKYIKSLYPDDTSIDAEITKYHDIFLKPAIDPKTYIAGILNSPRNEIKDVLISYFNGRGFKGNNFKGTNHGNVYSLFNDYLKTEYPCLYALWMQTNINQTGNNIGKYFETKLMLDQSIYDYADSLGIVIGYEYDGMSFYAKDDSNIQALVDYIKGRSIALLGIQLVFVDKVDTISIKDVMETNNQRILNDARKQWLKICRNTFRKGSIPNWESFKEQKANYQMIMKQHSVNN